MANPRVSWGGVGKHSEANATRAHFKHPAPLPPPLCLQRLLTSHAIAAFSFAHALHAAAVAITMSTPALFRGDAEERTRSGVAAEALYEEGKVTSWEREVELTATDEVALQAIDDDEDPLPAAHDPGEDAGEDGVEHAHAVHPAVCVAESEQQQPPKQKLVVQSADTAHASPGERVMQEPVCSAQAPHPRLMALKLQHAPVRHAPNAHDAFEGQGEPPGRHERTIERSLWLDVSLTMIVLLRVPLVAAAMPKRYDEDAANMAFVPCPSAAPASEPV